MSVQSLTESEVFSPCRIEHQDVFMYDESDIKDDSNSLCGRDGAESPTYLDISSSKLSSYQKHVDPDPTTLLSWTQKHPINWTQTEVLDWIYFVGDTVQMDQSTLRGEEFQNISGAQMCQMSEDEFVCRDAINGKCFFEMFASMHKNAHFLAPPRGEFTYYDQYCPLNSRVKMEPNYDIDIDEIQKTSKLLDSVICSNGKEMQVRLGEHWYPIDVAEIKEIEDIANVQSDANWMQDCWHGSSDSESTSDSSDMMDSTSSLRTSDFPSRCCSASSDVFSDDNVMTSFPAKSAKRKKPIANRRRQCHSDGHEKTQNRGRKPGQISKGNHLWEFIRDLLKDPELNPQYLRWEEKESGVFRFVQSEAVAQLWGRKKNNPGMTYEKLSRAMRFCRSTGYFAEVPKTGKFPKKLCFKFGAKAYGWEDN